MSISRPMVYKVLDDLSHLDLVEKKEEAGKVARFEAAHPLKLKEWVGKRKQAALGAETAFDGIAGKMISDFNLRSGKPGVRFFEGLTGIREVLEDSLTAHEIIYSYADLESIEKYIGSINRDYVKSREKLNIQKKGIVLDTPFAREFLKNYKPGITETRTISTDAEPFHTVMQIYDGKVSYITLSEQNIIGVIVQDPRIYAMHKYLFEYTWETATPLL
jgi:hypothetical protein